MLHAVGMTPEDLNKAQARYVKDAQNRSEECRAYLQHGNMKYMENAIHGE